MGKFFDEIFNQNNNNGDTHRFGVNVNITSADIELEDPDEIVEMYFEDIKEADSKEEVMELLIGLFYEGARYGVKQYLLEEVTAKIEALNILEYDLEKEV